MVSFSRIRREEYVAMVCGGCEFPVKLDQKEPGYHGQGVDAQWRARLNIEVHPGRLGLPCHLRKLFMWWGSEPIRRIALSA